MIIILFLCVTILLLGIVAYKFNWSLDSAVERLCGLGFVLCGTTFVVLLCAWLYTPILWTTHIANYEGVKTTLQDARSFKELTEFERVGIIGTIIEVNQCISRHRLLHDNFWIGAFHSRRIADLDLILIGKENNNE